MPLAGQKAEYEYRCYKMALLFPKIVETCGPFYHRRLLSLCEAFEATGEWSTLEENSEFMHANSVPA